MKRIFLYGPPASGKTTLGKVLAERLGATFVDLDAAIVEAAGRSIPEIFATDGEAAFRDLESVALAKAMGEADVVSLGGGTLLREDNRKLCEENGTVICLDAPSDEELARRIGNAAGSRPLGNKAKERAAHYASFPNRMAASFEAGPSLVIVGNGIAPSLIADLPCVADSTVANLYPLSSVIYHLPSGEQYKTPQTVMNLWHVFAEAGLGRRDVVAAIGGGVTGDLTGFAAATWMRGMDWINVPTTLLAMVDASTGGKTGCDLPEGKNLAGAFHASRLVVIDTDFLKTLPREVLAAGRAEMIKHEIIGGEKVKGIVQGQEILSAAEIAANLMVKVGIVREDPYEKLGRRILLNCGHTVAHAVEKLTDYRISHGEAVAIGCVEEARLAVKMGLAKTAWPDELAARFVAAGLPTALPEGIDFEKMRPVMKGDKKRKGDIVTFALPCGWGDVRAVEVDLGNSE